MSTFNKLIVGALLLVGTTAETYPSTANTDHFLIVGMTNRASGGDAVNLQNGEYGQPEVPTQPVQEARPAPPAPERKLDQSAGAESQTPAKVCKSYAKTVEDSEPLDTEAPRAEKCVMKRASGLLNFEPNFPMDRPDVYVETEIGDGTRFQFFPHNYQHYRDTTNSKGMKEGSIPLNNQTQFDMLFDEQEKLGGQGFKFRFVSKNGPGAWNSCKYSPIAFDLNGDGKVGMITSEKGFKIDITGDGDKEKLAQWFAPDEGILVDAKAEAKSFEKGKINGNHLMGDMAGKYTDGFAKLATYDENCDDKLSGTELDGLYIWMDKNSNLKMDDDELYELKDFGIKELSVIHDDLKSHATLTDNTEMLMQDLWFDAVAEKEKKAKKAKSLKVKSVKSQKENFKEATVRKAPVSAVKKATTKSGAFGDPHVRTWSGEHYSYHGACDLVLVKNPGFMDGLGMDVHIRNMPIKQWSYIDSAVLRIGGETLEVRGGEKSNEFYVNGVLGNGAIDNGMLPETIAGFPIEFNWLSKGRRSFTVDLGHGEQVVFKTFKWFIRVNVVPKKIENFGTAVGLMGSYPSGKKVARDGATEITDYDAFGAEWQVLASEPMLFHKADGPQAPQQCKLPVTTTQRRLAESSITLEDAEWACAHVDPEDRDECIFDVLATEDKDMAGAY